MTRIAREEGGRGIRKEVDRESKGRMGMGWMGHVGSEVLGSASHEFLTLMMSEIQWISSDRCQRRIRENRYF